MTYSLACPICEEHLFGTSWEDTDPLVLKHMNRAHPAPKPRKKKPVVDPDYLPEVEMPEDWEV